MSIILLYILYSRNNYSSADPEGRHRRLFSELANLEESIKLKTFYLVLAIVGAVVPMAFFAQFFAADQGSAQVDFISALFVNGATGGFTADLLISSFVFWAFMWSRRHSAPTMWPFVALNLFIGLSCALPAYLYFDSGRDPNVSQ